MGLLLAFSLHAQCDLVEPPGVGVPGTSHSVWASHRWDPDGAGPLPELLLVGGRFHQAGTTSATIIAAVDVTQGTYTALPNSQFEGGEIRALATMANGMLVACGAIVLPGTGQPALIAVYDGQQWSALDPSSPAPGGLVEPTALAVLPNGDLLAGGRSTQSTTLSRWNGSQWSIDATFTDPSFVTIHAIHLPANGDIVVGGEFSAVEGIPASNLALFDGGPSGSNQWLALGSGTDRDVRAITSNQAGDLIVAGDFRSIAGVPCGMIAQQSGATWTALQPQPQLPIGRIYALSVLASGELAATGSWNFFGGTGVGIYDGSAWRSPAIGLRPRSIGTGLALTELASGEVLVSGDFQQADAAPVRNVALLDPATDSLRAIGTGTNARVLALTRGPSGAVYAGGEFTQIEGVTADYLVRRMPAGGGWQSFAPTPNGAVHAVLELANGDVVIAGAFTAVGGLPAAKVARWDGSQWNAMDVGPIAAVTDLWLDPNGQIVTESYFNGVETIARWDGSGWDSFAVGASLAGQPGTLGQVRSAGQLANGDLVGISMVSGTGPTGARVVARWDGQTWSMMLPLPQPTYLDELFVLAGDTLQYDNHRWNGANWQPFSGLGFAVTQATAIRADGQNWLAGRKDLETGQLFVDNGTNPGNPSMGAWQQVLPEGKGFIHCLLSNPDGSLLCGGSQQRGAAGSFLTRIEPTCPALTTAYGSGCAGAGGIVSLQADGGAWTGGTAVANADGMLPGSLALPTIGLSPQNTPLTALLAEAYPGCALWHSTDLLLAPIAAPNGTASTGINIPAAPALAGQTFRSQVASLEFDPNGIAGIATSNGLLWVIGSF
ncbi:MAG: hypothetical protein AB8H80_13035 [Planctomycetota bacterium]